MSQIKNMMCISKAETSDRHSPKRHAKCFALDGANRRVLSKNVDVRRLFVVPNTTSKCPIFEIALCTNVLSEAHVRMLSIQVAKKPSSLTS